MRLGRGLDLPPLKPDLMKRSRSPCAGWCTRRPGSILAAATTSLPEEIGGVRNWDYRYCWLRDAALTASALVTRLARARPRTSSTGCTACSRRCPARSGCTRCTRSYGGGLPPEAVIDSLPGYAGSRPVRVGNAANQQVQLDVFGPIVDLISHLADARERQGYREH